MHFLYQTMKVMQNFMVNSFGFEVLLYMMYLSGPCSHVPSTQCSQNQQPSFFNFHPVTPDSYRKEIYDISERYRYQWGKKVKFDPSHQGSLWVLTLSGQES